MVCLAAGMVTVTLTAPSPAGSVDPPPALKSINPNVAPWWELAVLPRIGETMARRVVSYREAAKESGPVFRRDADLTQVHGIGPKTLARVGRHLRFDGE